MGQLLIWPTGNRVVAAAVTGLLPVVRYILLSDALVGRLADDEIRAVVAHEAGHVRHGHLGLRIMAMIAPVLLLVTAGQIICPADSWLAWSSWTGLESAGLAALLAPVAAGIYALLGFGPYCRLLEHQADVFACRGLGAGGTVAVTHGSLMSAPGTARFVAALERLGAEERSSAAVGGLAAPEYVWAGGLARMARRPARCSAALQPAHVPFAMVVDRPSRRRIELPAVECLTGSPCLFRTDVAEGHIFGNSPFVTAGNL